MKKLLLLISTAVLSLSASAQIYTYGSTNYELMFSYADLKYENSDPIKNAVRFTGFYNGGYGYNIDFNNFFGIGTGVGLWNVGLIAKDKDVDSVYYQKHRTYNLGIPITFKFGNMSNLTYFFFGGEAQLALNYKYKLVRYEDNKKEEKENEWFSDKTNLFMPTVFAGMQIKGTYLKFTYYLDNFFNTNYKDKNGNKPYDGLTSSMFVVSLGAFVSTDK